MNGVLHEFNHHGKLALDLPRIARRRMYGLTEVDRYVETSIGPEEGMYPYGTEFIYVDEGDMIGTLVLAPHETSNLDIINAILDSEKIRFASSKDYAHFEVLSPNPKMPDGLELLHISDTHFRDPVTNHRKVSGFSFLKDEQYDLIFCTGDIVHNGQSILDDETMEFFADLNSNYGKYFVLGNHDYSSGLADRVKPRMEQAGFRELTNTYVIMTGEDRVIKISGLDDFEHSGPAIGVFEDEFDVNIAITHNLDAISAATNPYVDLILSGHVHAGEVDVGLFDGTDLLKRVGAYRNINHQFLGFKYLTERTLSYISPGMSTRLGRFRTQPRTITHMTLRPTDIQTQPSYEFKFRPNPFVGDW